MHMNTDYKYKSAVKGDGCLMTCLGRQREEVAI
jgi:hypothetical protein